MVTMQYKIDDDVHKRLKVKAAEQGKTMKQIITEIISDYVTEEVKP